MYYIGIDLGDSDSTEPELLTEIVCVDVLYTSFQYLITYNCQNVAIYYHV